MAVVVSPYSDDWPRQFARVEAGLREALRGVPIHSIEHVGSTSVPGMAAKPILDIDIIVDPDAVKATVAGLEAVGYGHRGDLGVEGREALDAPDDDPLRHVYVCIDGTLHVRNHLAVRTILRSRCDLRDAYAAAKLDLAADPSMDIDTYIARKSHVLQQVLALSDLSEAERARILRLNDPAANPEIVTKDGHPHGLNLRVGG